MHECACAHACSYGMQGIQYYDNILEVFMDTFLLVLLSVVCSPLVRYGTTEMTATIIIIIRLFKFQCRMLRLIRHKCGRKEKRLGGGGGAGQKHCLMLIGNRQLCSAGMLSAAVRIQPRLTNLGPSLLSHQQCQRLHLDQLSVKSVTLKHISDHHFVSRGAL